MIPFIALINAINLITSKPEQNMRKNPPPKTLFCCFRWKIMSAKRVGVSSFFTSTVYEFVLRILKEATLRGEKRNFNYIFRL